MLIHVSALDCVYGLGNVPRIYLAMRGSLACREVEGASSRHIGRIIRRLVVTMDDGTDAPVCAGVACSAILEMDTSTRVRIREKGMEMVYSAKFDVCVLLVHGCFTAVDS